MPCETINATSLLLSTGEWIINLLLLLEYWNVYLITRNNQAEKHSNCHFEMPPMQISAQYQLTNFFFQLDEVWIEFFCHLASITMGILQVWNFQGIAECLTRPWSSRWKWINDAIRVAAITPVGMVFQKLHDRILVRPVEKCFQKWW